MMIDQKRLEKTDSNAKPAPDPNINVKGVNVLRSAVKGKSLAELKALHDGSLFEHLPKEEQDEAFTELYQKLNAGNAPGVQQTATEKKVEVLPIGKAEVSK